MARVLMKGAEVLCAAAIVADCKTFFGYPITPQNEVPEYMSKVLPTIGGTFVQAESEVAAINMVYGAAATGTRVMTSSSSPGIALKQEGITYIAGAQLPCVIASISRSGPGLGGILPSQADYFQATRGGGNGDYRTLVVAPANLQELSDLTQKAFYLADKYRNPVMVLADGMISQMMEPVEITKIDFEAFDHSSWTATGQTANRKPHIVTSVHLDSNVLEAHNNVLQAKYAEANKNEVMFEKYLCDDAEMIVVSYGSASRIVRNAVDKLRSEGIKVGLFRPITLYPFPTDALHNLALNKKFMLSAELSTGQMIDDIKIAVAGRCLVDFYGRTGGNIFAPIEIENKVKSLLSEVE